ncbi:hypothetical protein C8R46DRAFT_1093202 [Mycena filopes]|nr:hypothetical protein C8R46DRAFT_1093202 [Mycena filopes]
MPPSQTSPNQNHLRDALMASLFPPNSNGPPLPPFHTLLIKGPHHPSAPIHLALSKFQSQSVFPTVPSTSTTASNNVNATGDEPRVVMIAAPGRESLAGALRAHNDDWVGTHAGRGDVFALAGCTTVFYPPSPAHFAFLIEMLTTSPSTAALNDSKNANAILDQPPSLIILIGLSAYFLDDAATNPTGHPWTVSSYMTLVARTLASFAAFSKVAPMPIALALFDAQLDELKLPILKHPPGAPKKANKLENVAFYVQKYFDLLAVFEEDDEFFLNSSQEEENEMMDMDPQRRTRMHIFRRGQTKPFETWRWVEKPDVDSGGAVFVWDEINS